MRIILDIIVAALIFGALATVPLVTWLALAWLVTDRRRSSSRPETS